MAVNIDHTDDFFLDHFPYYNCQEGDRLTQALFLTKALRLCTGIRCLFELSFFRLSHTFSEANSEFYDPSFFSPSLKSVWGFVNP